MILITCLFFVVWGFYLLARKHKRVGWLFSIVGAVFFSGIAFGMDYSYHILRSALHWRPSPDLVPLIELLLIVVVIVLTGVFYLLLKRYFERNVLTGNDDLLDQ